MRDITRNMSFLILAGFFAGLFLGLPGGLFFEKAAINGKLYFPALCFRPSRNFFELLQRLDNIDDLKRLSGYYLYKETGLTDLEFLFERYKYDDSQTIRKTIIWIASCETDKKKLQEFYGKIFEISPPELQNVVVSRVEILGKDVYTDFISKYNYKPKRSK